MTNREKLYIGGVDQDDERCIRCGSFALDTGWECDDCGYDNMPHYYSRSEGANTEQQRAPSKSQAKRIAAQKGEKP